MFPTASVLLSLALMISSDNVAAGSFHRCDDGSRTPIYQTLPCAPGTRTLAQREYADAATPSRPGKPDAIGPKSRATPASRRPSSPATPLRDRRDEAIVAYACSLGADHWTQTQPCTADTPTRGAPKANRAKPRQRGLTRSDVCRQVRDGSYRGARGERAADSTYRRNLLRDRGGC